MFKSLREQRLNLRWLTLTVQLTLWFSVSQAQENSCTTIERRVPPVGLEVSTQQLQRWQTPIQQLRSRLEALPSAARPDIEVFLKSCEFALKYREIYKVKDFDKIQNQLAVARQRLEAALNGKTPWKRFSGPQVRGYRSSVDGSVQPVGLEFGAEVDEQDSSVPLYVWLHGRGDKTTDLHFIADRLSKAGKVVPENAIVMHPFGRQCIGYKSAGEIDVIEAIDFICQEYPIDKSKIVLMGFSMGGAGVWHIAAHYGERFIAASPGAGFAETARYQRLKPEDFPPKYTQMLWGVYDVPGYVRNLFNLPVVAYSGEVDKQIQAARVMEEAYQSEGRKLKHLIGPGMGHKYHPDTLQELLAAMDAVVSREAKGNSSAEAYIQTRHWRYGARQGVEIDGLQSPYEDTRVDIARSGQRLILSTRNVSRLKIDLREIANTTSVVVDGDVLGAKGTEVLLERQSNWKPVESFPSLRKRPGLSGPIDDAFLESFLVVLPSGKSSYPKIESWVQCEFELFKLRWESLFRGELRIKLDSEITAEDIAKYHLVCWGTPESNSVLKQAFQDSQLGPVLWEKDSIVVGENRFNAHEAAVSMIYPNPLGAGKYLVVNSGPTFRPAHDRTNSLQNPQLPDWVIFDRLETRNAEKAGEVAKCGFFTDTWGLDAKLTW